MNAGSDFQVVSIPPCPALSPEFHKLESANELLANDLIVDPKAVIRLTLAYPASTGR